MRKEHVENVHCGNMQNELTGKWYFASFSVAVFSFLFLLESVGRSVGLRAMRFISKMTHFGVLEAANTYAHTHTQIRINHVVIQYIELPRIQIIHTHSTYLRIRSVALQKRNIS